MALDDEQRKRKRKWLRHWCICVDYLRKYQCGFNPCFRDMRADRHDPNDSDMMSLGPWHLRPLEGDVSAMIVHERRGVCKLRRAEAGPGGSISRPARPKPR